MFRGRVKSSQMSQQERDRLDWLKRARVRKMTQRAAEEKMGVSERWARKPLQRLKRDGDRVVVHGLRGRPSNRKIRSEMRKRALEALQDPDWHGARRLRPSRCGVSWI